MKPRLKLPIEGGPFPENAGDCVVPAANGTPANFTLTFTKQDADALAAICDVALKAAGLPAAQSVNLWMRKIEVALTPPAQG